MFDVRTIVERNGETFYDYASGERQSQRSRVLLMVIASVALCWLLQPQSETFLNAVLTAQAILVGFSFSVLFFLLSNAEISPAPEESIERKIKRKKLAALAKELFHNVSYFNVVAICSVVLSLMLLLSGPDVVAWKCIVETISKYAVSVPDSVNLWASHAMTAAHTLAAACLYFCLFESAFTFFRTVVRVSYYFEQKLGLVEKQIE
jgi:hypothetical protein